MILKSELKQVPVEQRVPGKLYWVSDILEGEFDDTAFRIFKSGNESTTGTNWRYWFALPESMLPVRELPDEFELKRGEWEYIGRRGWNEILDFNVVMTRIKTTLPSLTIPSGSKSEQIAEIEKILAELKQS
jgi:hypothetical protein